MPAIEWIRVSKYYSRTAGVQDVRLSVEPGAFFGILGPAAAGKTTLLRLLMGYIRPNAGSVQALGYDSVRDSRAVRRLTGYVPAALGGYSGLRVRDILSATAAYERRPDYSRIHELCSALDLDWRLRFSELDDAERKKLCLVAALLRNPQLLVLDEPSLHLDPTQRGEFFDLLRRQNAEGITVCFTTRSAEEIRRYCSHAAILADGAVLAAGEAGELPMLRALRVTLSAAGGSEAPLAALGVRNCTEYQDSVSFTYTGEPDALIKTLAQFPIASLRIAEPTLESVLTACRVGKGPGGGRPPG